MGHPPVRCYNRSEHKAQFDGIDFCAGIDKDRQCGHLNEESEAFAFEGEAHIELVGVYKPGDTILDILIVAAAFFEFVLEAGVAGVERQTWDDPNGQAETLEDAFVAIFEFDGHRDIACYKAR